MFGYIVMNPQMLSKERQQRFRAFYCGLCRTLYRRYGLMGTATLSYDMTFLAMLLNALYEPEEHTGEERCALHPVKRHAFVDTPVLEYAADMNVALAYHKCRDNWADDHSLPAAAEAGLLASAYRKVAQANPDKCAAIEGWLSEIHALESSGREEIDPPVNATGRMLGELFDLRSGDTWSEALRAIGDGIGRFIYFMDAYEDLPEDLRRKRFNPLKPMRDLPDYEEMCRSALMMMAADATCAFEQLPIVLDADILCNVLYSGIWSKYAYLQKRRQPHEEGAK